MSSKRWILMSCALASLFFMIFMIFTLLLVESGVPLRFSNSISYDAKLNFIHNRRLLNGVNTIIIGSSMGLSDINGLVLQKSCKTSKVANLSSWGMNACEVLELFKMINLKNIKYVIYGAQYSDFSNDKKSIKIDKNEVRKFLQGDFLIKPYLKTANKIMLNLKKYIKYNSKYLNKHKYQNLDFDSVGDALYATKNFDIKEKRWNQFEFNIYSLSDSSFNDLVKIIKICKSRDIKFFLVIPPIRKVVLKSAKGQEKLFKKFVAKISYLSKKYSFTYINMHKLLELNDSYFVDAIHLNKKGATEVSKAILKKL